MGMVSTSIDAFYLSRHRGVASNTDSGEIVDGWW
jgi:hypothetical protein